MRIKCFLFFIFLVSSLAAEIDFKKEIWPILEERCVECHQKPYEKNGALKLPKAGLRLDGASYIMHGSDDGPVLVVNHPSKSSIYQRVILPEDDSDHMPPKGGSLSEAQTELLRMWIAQGVDFGAWVGATDGLDNLVSRKKAVKLPQASYLSGFDRLAQGVNPVGDEILKDVASKSGLLIRPLGVGSILLEARVVTEPDQIGDDAIINLLSLKDNLVKVDLRNTKITNKSLEILASFPRLKNLNLTRTLTDSHGISFFKSNQSLESLNLVDTKVCDLGVETLLSMISLRQVHLWQSDISTSGISLLQKKAGNLKVSF